MSGLELRPQLRAGISQVVTAMSTGVACKFQLQKDKLYSTVLVCEVLKEEGESTRKVASGYKLMRSGYPKLHTINGRF